MSSEPSGQARRRRRIVADLKNSLRELGTQLALLNHQVGSKVALKDVDFGCFDLIARDGPVSPSGLAHRAGLHPATITGVLDRLERGGWVARERDPADRRAILVRALREHNAELFRLYAGMSSSLDQICAGYEPEELELIRDFVRRTTVAGRDATDDLADT